MTLSWFMPIKWVGSQTPGKAKAAISLRNNLRLITCCSFSEQATCWWGGGVFCGLPRELTGRKWMIQQRDSNSPQSFEASVESFCIHALVFLDLISAGGNKNVTYLRQLPVLGHDSGFILNVHHKVRGLTLLTSYSLANNLQGGELCYFIWERDIIPP